jgi:multidrug transporter EmrE-like cation transporter
MIAGALAICSAKASESERVSWKAAMERECVRYDLDSGRVSSSLLGEDPLSKDVPVRHWWEVVVAAAAVGVFLWLAVGARHQPVAVNYGWGAVLVGVTLVCLVGCGWLLWKKTKFS